MKKFVQYSLLFLMACCACCMAQAQHTYFEPGDMFLGQGGGFIQWRDSNHVLIRTINTGDGGGNGNGTGLRINPFTGQLWVTNSNLPLGSTNGIRLINMDGSVGGTINISAYQKTPTSITFDNQGNAYIGGQWNDTGDEIVKINAAGTAILDHFKVSSDGFIYGAEWVEMDCNDSIIYYTTQGKKVKRYNVASRQQLTDHANLADSVSWLFAMRLLTDNTMLVVAADHLVKRLDSTGRIIKTYGPTNTSSYFGLAVTPDKKSFWVGGQAFSAPMHKYDIASGNMIDSFLAGPQAVNIHGIAIFNDDTKNCRPLPPPDSFPQRALTSLHTFPNPSRGSFIVQTNFTGRVILVIHDKLGQSVYGRIYDFSGNDHNIPVDISNLAAGVYFVQLINDGRSVSKKIVIR